MSNESSVTTPLRLDDLDLRLIKLLESDPRSTHTNLAANLGISRPTVGSMLQKLYDARIIHTACLADHIALGFTNSVVFAINAPPGCLVDVADKLASLDHIHYVALCAGPFDIVSWGVFKGRHDLLGFLTEGLGKIPGISRHETILCQELKISPALLADSQGYRPRESRATLDDLDLALIGSLQRNSRETASGLAAKLDISKPTVLRRMRRLLDEGTIRFVTMVNPFALGYKWVASIGMKVAPGRVNEVADAVAAYRTVHTVALCTGRYDVLAWVIFKEQQELMDMLTVELGKIPGINSMETVTNLKTVKASYISVDWQGELWKGLKQG